MSTLATLAVVLTLADDAYHRGLTNATKDTQDMTNVWGGLANVGKAVVVGAVAAVGLGVAATSAIMKDAVSDTMTYDASLYKMAEALGTTADQNAGMLSIANKVGISQETLTMDVERFGKNLETSNGKMGTGAKALQDLGINAYDTHGKLLPTTTLLQDIGDKLNAMPAGLEKDRYEMEMFGRSGTDLNEMLSQMSSGGLANAMGFAASIGLDQTDAQIDSAKQLGYSWQTLQQVGQGAFTRIGDAIIPVLNTVLTKFLAWVTSPEIQAGIQNIANDVAGFAATVAADIPIVVQWFMNVYDWLNDHRGVIVGILAALGVAVVAFAVTSIIAMAPMIPMFLGVVAIMAVVGVAAYSIYAYWQQYGPQIKSVMADIISWMTTAWGNISVFFANLWVGVENIFINAINNIIGEIDAFLIEVNRVISGADSLLGLKIPTIGLIAKIAGVSMPATSTSSSGQSGSQTPQTSNYTGPSASDIGAAVYHAIQKAGVN